MIQTRQGRKKEQSLREHFHQLQWIPTHGILNFGTEKPSLRLYAILLGDYKTEKSDWPYHETPSNSSGWMRYKLDVSMCVYPQFKIWHPRSHSIFFSVAKHFSVVSWCSMHGSQNYQHFQQLSVHGKKGRELKFVLL